MVQRKTREKGPVTIGLWLVFSAAAILLTTCAPQATTPTAPAATTVAASTGESQLADRSTLTPTLTAGPSPTLTATPAMTPPATAVVTPTAPPTTEPPVTPLPPAPVFAGLMKHELVIVSPPGQASTLSYLTGVESEGQIAAMQAAVETNCGDSMRLLVEDFTLDFSPNRQLMAFLIEPPIEREGDMGGVENYIAVMNESGQLLADTYIGGVTRWLPDSLGSFFIGDLVTNLVYLDGRS